MKPETLQSTTSDLLISSYLDHCRTRNEDLFWAWERVDELTYQLESGLQICVALTEAAASDEELAYIAAGPLEDFLNRVGLEAARSLETPARQSAKLRAALKQVWLAPEAAAYEAWRAMVR